MRCFASLVLALNLVAVPLLAQNTTAPANPPQPAKASSHPFGKPRAEAAPGGGRDKVWVNTTSRVYHCYGDRYYGKTANGKYMTEKDAIAMGAHGSRGETCGK